MNVKSMRDSSKMSNHFIVREKIKLHLSVEWQKNDISNKRFNTKGLKIQEIKRQHKNKLKETFQIIDEQTM